MERCLECGSEIDFSECMENEGLCDECRYFCIDINDDEHLEMQYEERTEIFEFV